MQSGRLQINLNQGCTTTYVTVVYLGIRNKRDLSHDLRWSQRIGVESRVSSGNGLSRSQAKERIESRIEASKISPTPRSTITFTGTS